MTLTSPTGARARPAALDAETLCAAFQITAAACADRPALRMKGSDVEITWGGFASRMRRLAGGFAALGVGAADTVGFMLVNRPELHLCDCAAMHLGAVGFSIYNTSAPEQIDFVLADAGCRVVVTEQAFLARVLAARERVPSVEHVVAIDGEPPDGVLSLGQLEARDDGSLDFEAAWRAVRPDDLLTLIYTSGTTGPPKGVELTHRNVLSALRGFDAVYPIGPGGHSISYLPTAHVADRWAHLYGSMVYGYTVHCCSDPRAAVFYCPEVRPTMWTAVPRIYEKLMTTLEAAFAAEADEERRRRTKWALDVGRRRARVRQTGKALPAELRGNWERADEQVWSGLRRLLGLDRVEWFFAGAAPMRPEVLEFFSAIGIDIAELWGMSETACVSTVNPPGRLRFGTVGTPLPAVELELADDGEVLVRGSMVMKGYRNRAEATREAIDAEGWLHTGDVGAFDDAGYLRIVDRKKELIINAAGKNMSPAGIEAKVRAASPLVAHAVAIGDRRPYNIALIALDPDASQAFAGARGIAGTSPAELAREPALVDEVAAAVGRANARLSRVEQIKRFRVLPTTWEPGGDELTPTLKLKRKPIADKYARDVEALYAGNGDEPR